MSFARRSLITMLLLGILLTAVLTACGAPAATEAPVDVDATIAAGAQTLAAALFQTQTAIAPTATYTPLATLTSLPTNTALALPSPGPATATQAVLVYWSPTPTGTFYTATPSSSSLAVGCNNLRLINSYTDPSGNLLPGQTFTQYWQVENNGTCDWLYLYSIEFVSGDKLGEATSVRFGNKIPPGKWTTLSVTLHAPKNSGTYKSSWRFSDGAGKLFGATLPVSITVKSTPDPTATPNIAQTVAAGVQQTSTAAAQQTAVQAGVNTAIAATNACATFQATNPGTPCP